MVGWEPDGVRGTALQDKQSRVAHITPQGPGTEPGQLLTNL